jgi:hypothetical protein
MTEKVVDIKEQLAKGAAEIHKAQNAQKSFLTFVESERPSAEIMKERVEVLPGWIGLKISDATPMDECMKIVDRVRQMHQNVSWMLGDLINFGNQKYGDELFQRVMNQTGRGYSTLAGYAETAKKIPLEQRIPLLGFSSHREIAAIPDVEKRKALLGKVDAEMKQGDFPTRTEIRERAGKLKPKKAAKRGKTKKVVALVKPPTAEQKSKLGKLRKLITPARALLISLTPTIKLLSAKDRDNWEWLLTPFANLCDDLS